MSAMLDGENSTYQNFSNDSQLICQVDCGLAVVDDQASFLVYNLILQGFTLPLIALFGLVGNMLSFFVFTRKEMLCSLGCYLSGLALSDSIVVVCSTFMFTSDALKPESPILQQMYLGGVTVIYPLATMAHTASIYFTVMATWDCCMTACETRFGCVQWIDHRRLSFAVRAILGVVVFAVSYNICRCFETEVMPCLDTRTNTTTRQVCLLPLRVDPMYNEIYYKYLYTGIIVVGPLVVLTAMTLYIVLAMVAAKRRPSAAGRVQEEEAPTAMILVVLLFLFCNILGLMVNFLEDVPELDFIMNYLLDISNTLVVINSSLNFLIYLTFDLKFRDVFCRWICRAESNRTPIQKLSLMSDTPLLNLNGLQKRDPYGQSSQVALLRTHHESNFASAPPDFNTIDFIDCETTRSTHC